MKHLLPILALAACTDVPTAPTFQQDVAPILAANCSRCHGVPQIGGAPPTFRLTYSPIPLPDMGGELSGAARYAYFMRDKVVSGEMPARFPLDDDQRDVIANWAALVPRDDANQQDAPRGEPRPGNRAPFATLIQTRLDNQFAEWDFTVGDDDGDLVGGYLRAGDIVVGELHSGRGHLVWEIQNVPALIYALEAELDDGGAVVTISLGEIRVP